MSETTTPDAVSAEPRRRMTAIERAQKQLDDARAKEQAKMRAKLPKALAETTAARAALKRAEARLEKAATEARQIQDFLGDVAKNELVLTPAEIADHNDTIARDGAAQGEDYSDLYVELGESFLSHAIETGAVVTTKADIEADTASVDSDTDVDSDATASDD